MKRSTALGVTKKKLNLRELVCKSVDGCKRIFFLTFLADTSPEDYSPGCIQEHKNF